MSFEREVLDYKLLHTKLFVNGWTKGSVTHYNRLFTLHGGVQGKNDPTLNYDEVFVDGAGIFRRFGTLVFRMQYGGMTVRNFQSYAQAKLFLHLVKEVCT